MNVRYVIMALPLVLVTGIASAFLLNWLLQVQWPDWRWHQMALHSTMEAIGGVASIAMAIVLLKRHEEPGSSKFQLLASGFLGMGILEVFHAMAQPGNSFVLLRNVASFAGGVGFGLMCLHRPRSSPSPGTWIPWGVTVGASMFGAWALAFPDQIPEMIRDGRFTPTAVAPQSLACLLFLAATVHFLLNYRQSKKSEDLVFASLALMFGIAEVVFMYSIPWDHRWWFWHVLRLAAYLLVLREVSRGYFRMVSDLKASLEQTTRAEGALRQSEQHLRRSLDDRERMAQDLHDGSIQSIFAVTLNLERCQRLIRLPAKEVIGQLGAAIADLKSVIRDLRGYLVGLEPPIYEWSRTRNRLRLTGQEYGEPCPAPFRLAVDPVAADRVTPEQASHLLSVAREALSNSLRHSAAKTGTVSLQFEEDHVRLIVEDDGSGFHATALQDQGHGLRNMAARARRLEWTTRSCV